MDLSNLAEPWIEIGRRLQVAGIFGGAVGSVSQRYPEGARTADGEMVHPGTWLVSGRGALESALTPSDFTLLAPDRFSLAGPEPSVEWEMHESIYHYRSDVHAVVHAHPPYATALGLAGMALPEGALAELAVTFGHVPLVPYATPATSEVGITLHVSLGQAWGALLEQHGAITLGATPEDAAARMERLERCAQTWILARLLLGAEPRTLDAAQIAAARKAVEPPLE